MNNAYALTRRGFLAAAAFTPLAALLAGCSSENDTSQAADEPATAPEETSAAASGDASAGASPASGNVLVAYYSAQGHTEAVAQAIADELGADLFEVTPTEPYTDEDLTWTDDESRVSREHDDEILRNVPLQQVTPDGWADYDTVFVGYPIWWAIAAWPINGFVAGNDWEGKTVIPFCTSASSGLGQSGELLSEAAGAGDWQEGQRFSSSVPEDEVRTWAASVA